MTGETMKTAKPASEKRMGYRHRRSTTKNPPSGLSDGGPELLCIGSIITRFCGAAWSKHSRNHGADENQCGANCCDIQLRDQVESRDQAHVTPP
jgi:hypothetical protein